MPPPTQRQNRDWHRPWFELRVRSPPSTGDPEVRGDVTARLDELETDGTIDRYDVLGWGREYRPTSAPQIELGRTFHERLVELDEWAACTGLSVAPFFRMRTGRSGRSGRDDVAQATLVHPPLVLAEYVDTELRHISPCTDGQAIYSVDDHLDAVENGVQRVPNGPASRPMQVPALVPRLHEAKRHDDERRPQIQ